MRKRKFVSVFANVRLLLNVLPVSIILTRIRIYLDNRRRCNLIHKAAYDL